MPKKRILIYGLSNSWGGIESVVLDFSKYIIKYAVLDIILPIGHCSYEEKCCSPVVRFIHIASWGGNRSVFCDEIKKILLSNSYDYLWINICVLANNDIISLAIKYSSAKIITHSHASSFEEKNFYKRVVLYLLHYWNRKYYVRHSDFLCMCSRRAGVWLFGSKTVEIRSPLYVRNGIDVDKYLFNSNVRNKFRKELKIGSEIALFHAGRLTGVKNQLRLFKIVQVLLKRGVKVKLFLAGDGELRVDLERYIIDNNLIDNIFILGQRDNVNDLMQAMDLFLLPSFHEGFGIALVEAQATGLPCIASDGVPNETNVGGLVSYLSLKESDEYWADEIMKKASANIERINFAKIIAEHGFDISRTCLDFINYIILC